MIPDRFQDASEGGPFDAIQRDRSDGRAYPNVFGVRERELERIGVVPALRGLPRHVLRMAQAEGERRSGMVPGPLACALAVLADHGWCDCREGDCGAAAISVLGAPQPSRGA